MLVQATRKLIILIGRRELHVEEIKRKSFSDTF